MVKKASYISESLGTSIMVVYLILALSDFLFFDVRSISYNIFLLALGIITAGSILAFYFLKVEGYTW